MLKFFFWMARACVKLFKQSENKNRFILYLMLQWHLQTCHQGTSVVSNEIFMKKFSIPQRGPIKWYSDEVDKQERDFTFMVMRVAMQRPSPGEGVFEKMTQELDFQMGNSGVNVETFNPVK